MGAEELDNLVVQPKASATRVLMEGKRAVGVEWAINGNANRLDQAFAEGSVILAGTVRMPCILPPYLGSTPPTLTVLGGAINSPQLLMLSGIGPAEELKKHNINVVLDAPGVGQNLQVRAAMPHVTCRPCYGPPFPAVT